MEKINLGIIFGGRSGEHEVSLSSAQSIIDALNKKKYNIVPIAITKKGDWLIGEMGWKYLEMTKEFFGVNGGVDLELAEKISHLVGKNNFLHLINGQMKEKIDFIIPIIHGSYGEDGKLQGMLEMFSVPYLFSGCLASALAMNKTKAKIIAKNVRIPVLDEVLINKFEKFDLEKIIKKIKFPMVIKPIELGSSVGVTIVKKEEELDGAINEAMKYGDDVMIEKYAKGREFTVTVMGNRNPVALPIIEIIPVISSFYDYRAKYEKNGSEHVCPAQIPKEIGTKMEKYAISIFKELGCSDLARADFIYNEDSDEIYFLDLNTIPGMTATSLSPESARESGLSFTGFLDILIENAVFNKSK